MGAKLAAVARAEAAPVARNKSLRINAAVAAASKAALAASKADNLDNREGNKVASRVEEANKGVAVSRAGRLVARVVNRVARPVAAVAVAAIRSPSSARC